VLRPTGRIKTFSTIFMTCPTELLSSRHVRGNRTVGDYSGTGREGERALIRQSEKPYDLILKDILKDEARIRE